MILSKWPKNVTMRQSVDTSHCLCSYSSFKNSIPIIRRICHRIYIVGLQFEILGQKQNTFVGFKSQVILYWPKVFLLQFNALLIRNFSIAKLYLEPATWFIQLNFTFWWSLFPHPPPLHAISKSSWLQTIINLASSIILSLSSLSECTQKYSQKMHQKPWVLSVIHSKTKNTHHLKLVFNSTANLDIRQLWFF